MRKTLSGLLVAVFGVIAVPAVVILSGRSEQAQVPGTRAGEGAPAARHKLEDILLQWPPSPGNEAYSRIDGRHLHTYIVEQVAIARRYRDQGHQLWGRIIGTSSDAESAQWVANKFRQIGLSDVRLQPLDLAPQWLAHSWEVTITGGGTTRTLATAQPTYRTPATRPEGLDLEAVYVGLGSEGDFAGRDVRGKAVLLFGMPRPGSGTADGASARARDKGAAAVITVNTLPGNLTSRGGGGSADAPSFTVGREDGLALRELIAQAPAGQAPHVKIRLDAGLVPNLKTAMVWGTLPGATDETIYVIAHRESWFDGATDNASGVAAMIGLAEYFAKVPQAQRRRTMMFIGTDGHHNSGNGQGAGREWMVANRATLFAKTALMVNCEHPATLQTYLNGPDIRWANTSTAQQWYAGGPSRPKLQDAAIRAFREFGVATYAQPNRAAPSGDLGRFWWFLPGVATSDFNMYFHTDAETPETVPWTGLEATTRAYARIIDEVNKLALADLQRPEGPDPRAPRPATTATAGPGQAPAAAGGGSQDAELAPAVYTLEDAFLQWPVLKGNEAYASIDGKRLHALVVDQAAMARRYRDQGHPFWGRIIGTSADAESAQWLLARFKQIGLSDVRLQSFDLTPQWFAQSWEVTATGGGKTLPLPTAYPALHTPATPVDGLNLEAVYVGLGSEADFAGRDVRGKAVVVFGMPRPGGGEEGVARRAETKGAAAILNVHGLPGNTRSLPGTAPGMPTFSLGRDDGTALRALIEGAPAGQTPHVRIRLATQTVPNLKSATVWGVLPGRTDETIYILAHRDGWFDGATDNASGVATLIGLAEHFAKIPQAQRRRTMYFLGVNGHHNRAPGGDARVKAELSDIVDAAQLSAEVSGSRSWLVANRGALFARTALIINSEHPSTLQTYLSGDAIRDANTYTALEWYAGGPLRPNLEDLTVKIFREFGVSIYSTPEFPRPPGGEMLMFWRFLPGVTSSDYNMYFHTDAETPETVPWTGLEAVTRAYAKIVDEVNKLDLNDLQRPPERPPATSASSR